MESLFKDINAFAKSDPTAKFRLKGEEKKMTGEELSDVVSSLPQSEKLQNLLNFHNEQIVKCRKVDCDNYLFTLIENE